MRLAAEALLAVKAALHDTANVLADWNAGSGGVVVAGGGGGGGPCNWSMVTCSKTGHVSVLYVLTSYLVVHFLLCLCLSPPAMAGSPELGLMDRSLSVFLFGFAAIWLTGICPARCRRRSGNSGGCDSCTD